MEELLKSTIPENMLRRGLITLDSELKPLKNLFEQRRVPDIGLEDEMIEKLHEGFRLVQSLNHDKYLMEIQ